MRVIGLTGGIASGKSTVSAMLAGMGAPVFDADKEAHALLAQSGLAWQDIKDRFGSGILAADGNIDRKKLGEIVFSDRAELAWLEGVTHIHVENRRKEFVENARREGCLAVVLDIPLLIEKEIYKNVDEVWLVYLPREVQLERLLNRDRLTVEQAEKRLAAQLPLAEKRKYASVVIDNSGNVENTRRQVEIAWEKILEGGQ